MIPGGTSHANGPVTTVRFADFLLANAVLLAAWSLWLARVAGVRGSANAVYTGLLCAAQLVLTQLALGAFGWLRLPALLFALGIGAAALLVHALRRGRAPARPKVLRGELLGPANLALAALVLFAATWILVAAWLLPPRGVDDLAYHLPPLYHYVQTGRVTLLPLELRTQFGMPLGGDFLYLWPAIFFHSDTWVDAVGLGVAAYGAVVVYALARALDAGRRDAAFAGLLFPLLPVVLAQAGASYSDLALVAAHLALLYAAVQAWRDGGRIHVLMAGLAAGFGLGVKYNMLVAIALALPLVWLALWRWGGIVALVRGTLSFAAAFIPLPAYWLVRNAVVTGEPLYPYALSATGLRPLGVTPEEVVLEEGASTAGPALLQLFEEPVRLLGYLFRDPGLGTLNGGYGVVFWGLALPALAWCLAQSVGAVRRRDWLPLLLWATPVLTFLVFLQQTEVTRLPFNMRLALVVPALALVALAVVLGQLRAGWPAAAGGLRLAAVAASAVAVGHLAGDKFPTFDVSAATADRRAGTATTPQRYYRGAHGDLPSLAAAFEPLDWITREGPGWSVYMAADWRVFITAPLFGSSLQNRVWNFLDEPRGQPDAVVFHSGFSGGAGNLYYIRGQITPADVAGTNQWRMLVRQPPTELWVSAARMNDPTVRARLTTFIEKRYADDVAAFEPVARALPPADVVVGASSAVHALRYHRNRQVFREPVELVRPGGEAEYARRMNAKRVITVGVPLPGAQTRLISTVRTSEGTVSLYYNEVTA